MSTPKPKTIGDLKDLRLEIMQGEGLTLGGFVEEFLEFVGEFDPSVEEYGEDERASPVWKRLKPAIRASEEFLRKSDSTPVDESVVSMLVVVSNALSHVPSVIEIVQDVAPNHEELFNSGEALLEFQACFNEAVIRLK